MKSADYAFRFAIAVTVIVIGLVIVAVWYFVRRAVLLPIDAAVGHAERIAGGDLTADIRSESRDETGQLLRSLAAMKESLAGVVARVRSSAEAVVSSARLVADGTTDLSQRTEEQATSLEETAASMEELASTVKQNAENAREADELARTASKRAEQGGTEVVRVVETMSEISRSASRIAEIISVIDAIAFQTNILALNAAVEAARAGEQGRGFAVVASEVRSLAQRSAQAAKEIKDLISDSVQKVDQGTHQVEQAGDTIQALVIDVQRVSDLMRSIAEASAEQSLGVQQVNRTVTEMDKVVQQNASAVQASNAAAESMRQQAGLLLQAVGTFRIAREAGGNEAWGADGLDSPWMAEPRALGASRAGVNPSPAWSSRPAARRTTTRGSGSDARSVPGAACGESGGDHAAQQVRHDVEAAAFPGLLAHREVGRVLQGGERHPEHVDVAVEEVALGLVDRAEVPDVLPRAAAPSRRPCRCLRPGRRSSRRWDRRGTATTP